MAVLGASSYTFCEATPGQDLASWVGSHQRAFEFFGGVPELVVPDNLKAGVTKPSYYEPELNRTYEEMGEHYGTAILPARPRRPRDKAKVEVGVQVVQRWIVMALRNRRFYSLAEVNEANRRTADEAQPATVSQAPWHACGVIRATGPAGAAAVTHAPV